MARGKRVDIVKITVIGPDGTPVEVDGKACTKCGEIKALTSFMHDRRKSDGRKPACNSCEKSRKAEYMKRNPNYRRDYYADNRTAAIEYTRQWSAANRDKKNTVERRRSGLEAALPYSAFIDGQSRCGLTGIEADIQMDHWLPLSSGHGGTYAGNTQTIAAALNLSKRNVNPFEWFEANRQRFELSQSAFDALVAKLAQQNGLTSEEFCDFTYWCFANKRTVEQVRADNERYGYKKPSLEIWRESIGLPFPIRVDFGDLTLDYTKETKEVA